MAAGKSDSLDSEPLHPTLDVELESERRQRDNLGKPLQRTSIDEERPSVGHLHPAFNTPGDVSPVLRDRPTLIYIIAGQGQLANRPERTDILNENPGIAMGSEGDEQVLHLSLRAASVVANAA